MKGKLLHPLLCLTILFGVQASEIKEAGDPLIIHSGGSLAVIINSQTGCQVSQLNSSSRKEAQLFPKIAEFHAFKVSTELLSEFVDLCQDGKKEFQNPSQLVSDVRENTRFLYPGTKYCGSGNSSTGADDLGEYVATDKCCQEHDSCQDFIPGRSCSRSKGLCNRTPFTRSSCTCDDNFRQCLLAANETASNRVGKLYFNVFGLQCYRRDHPVVRCTEWGGFLGMHCQSYKLDYSKPKVWQFFDSPKFVPTEELESDRTDEEEAINWLTLVFNP